MLVHVRGKKRHSLSVHKALQCSCGQLVIKQHVVPCGMSKRNRAKGAVNSCSGVFGGGWGTGRGLRRGFTELIFGLSLKRINEFHQVPSFSLHFITIFFLMVLICYFSFLTTFTAQSCAFYFPFPPFL